jgi:hypothetical protein
MGAFSGLGVAWAAAQDVSDRDEIVGTALRETDYGNGHAYRLAPGGSARILEGGAGDRWTEPSAVNAAGLISGYAADEGGSPHPVVWDAGDRMIDLLAKLPTLGGRVLEGAALDVNDAGLVVGSYTVQYEMPAPPPSSVPPTTMPLTTVPSPGVPRTTVPSTILPGTTLPTSTPPTTNPLHYREEYVGFVWDSVHDSVRLIRTDPTDPFNSPWMSPSGIADDGTVIGNLDDRIVRWIPQPDGSYRTVEMGRGFVMSVNGAGAAIGAAYDRGAGSFYWAPGSTTPIVLVGRAGHAEDLPEALDLNDAGVLVGTLAYGEVTLPVRWAAPTANAQLIGSGPSHTEARAVNRSDTIVGMTSIGFDWHPVVWDP